ncbi:MAG: hypothetical protein U1F81_08450 [Verrucomicrobiaceae bacterium]
MRRRSIQRRSSSFRWLWWLVGVLVIAVVVGVMAMPALVMAYLQSVVRGEGFRVRLEDMIESKTGGSARLADIQWQDDAARMSEASIELPSGLQIEAVGVHAALDFGAIRRGSWSIQSAGADSLIVTKHPASPNASKSHETANHEEALPGWVSRYIPKTTEVDGFDAERFAYSQNGWQVEETRLHLGSYNSASTSKGRFSFPGTLDGGVLRMPVTPPGQKEPLRLDIGRASFRLTDEKLQITESTLRWKDRSKGTLRGSVRFGGEWQFFAHAEQVPSAEFLSEEWQKHLSGHLEGDAELSGAKGQPMKWKADIALKDGVLSSLPILDKLATYTRMERFKRLALDIATASVSPHSSGGTRLEKIVIQSNGLMRLEGTLTLLPGDAIEGDFMVGVTPETLRWLPGAQNRVFIETNPQGPPGLNWARVKVGGTRTAPQEDLSSRLLGAAGMSLLLDSPGAIVNKASDTLLKPVLGEDAAKLPGQIINGTTKTLEQGVKTGTDLINKVIPIFPGK